MFGNPLPECWTRSGTCYPESAAATPSPARQRSHPPGYGPTSTGLQAGVNELPPWLAVSTAISGILATNRRGARLFESFLFPPPFCGVTNLRIVVTYAATDPRR